MKKLIHVLAALSLLFSCAPENGFNDDQTVSPAKEIPAGAVDLGMVMTRADGSTYRLYWAKSNLSDTGLCIYPEDYGDYYAWGEVKPRSVFSLPTYRFHTSGDELDNVKFSKYNTQSSYGPVDNKTVLDPEDDAAQAKLGGRWRMPTAEECKALITQCTWVWITQNGINGRLATAKNGNSIFFPAAGFRYDTWYPGAEGSYWSSSLNTGYPIGADCLKFNSMGVTKGGYGRDSGHSVRPVYED